MSRLSVPSADGQQAHAEREPDWMGEARKEDRERKDTSGARERQERHAGVRQCMHVRQLASQS